MRDSECRGTPGLTYQLRLALEPECLQNPTDHRRKKFQDGTDWPETFKLFVVSDVGRRVTGRFPSPLLAVHQTNARRVSKTRKTFAGNIRSYSFNPAFTEHLSSPPIIGPQ